MIMKMEYKIFSSFLWKWLERSGVQGIKFVVQILLARLLMPEEYGLIALVLVFIAIADAFVQSGLNMALIQKRDTDELDFCSVFYASIVLAVGLYFILFITAPLIANFLEQQLLISIVRILSLNLFFTAVNSIQNAYISRRMQFKLNFISSLGGIIISGIIGILLAYAGYGVWSLVIQQLINQFLITMILWFTVKWRPTLIFSIHRLKLLFSYGCNILGASLVALLTENMYILIIGRVYDAQLLGYYDRGRQFPFVIIGNINSSMTSVLFPVYSTYQDDLDGLKSLARRSISLSTFVILPAMAGLIAIAEPLVSLLLTDKWIFCVPFLRLECLFYATLPLMTAISQTSRAIGRSDLSLKLEVLKTILTLIMFFVVLPLGIYVVVGMRSIISILIVLINVYISKRLIGYSFTEWFQDIAPSLVLSTVMGVMVYLLGTINLTPIILLPLQIVLGICLYLGIAYLLKMNIFISVLKLFKSYIKN